MVQMLVGAIPYVPYFCIFTIFLFRSILFIGTELTPHFHFTPHDCYIWQIYQGVAASTIVVTVDTVLILRSKWLPNVSKRSRLTSLLAT